MKGILVSSLGLVMAASAWGQHAGSAGHGGGGSGHAGGGFSSGRSFTAPTQMPSSGASRLFGGSPAYRPNSFSQRPTAQYNSPTGPAPFGGTYPYGERARGGQRGDGHRPSYSRGVYLVPGYLNAGFYGGGSGYDYGYADDSSDQQQSSAAGAGDANYYAAPDAGSQQMYEQPPARQPYQPEGNAGTADIQNQPQVTLLFKDGRPPQQVQNYAVTRTTLYVLDGARRREIPLSQLDLPQTEKTNRDAGVDFSIPIAN